VKPFFCSDFFPLSLKGEGDIGGEVDITLKKYRGTGNK
jgi:hypothetical protein